jgi:hypothetical protein
MVQKKVSEIVQRIRRPEQTENKDSTAGCEEEQGIVYFYLSSNLILKVALNDAQKTWILRHYMNYDGLTILCKMHLQEFARIGNSVYQDLMTTAKQRADDAPPIYDQPDPLAKPKKSKRAANKKSEESLAVLKKFFKEKTHPLPDKEPIRIFFADIPSYRALYKKYKLANPKGSAHFFSWATWNYYRRSRFPWVKVRLMVVYLFLLLETTEDEGCL